MGIPLKDRGAMGFYVSRQCHWGLDPEEGQYTVEVARGGSDYANPGQLVDKFKGEGRTYTDPREAVRVAVRICMEWRREVDPKLAEYINVSVGDTWGYTSPFEPADFAEAIEWANEEWEKLPKCAGCGQVYNPNSGWSLEFFDEYIFCSSWCVEQEQAKLDVMRMLDILEEEDAQDTDEVYVSDYGYTRVNPTEDEIEEDRLQYAGTAAYVRHRYSRFESDGVVLW